MAILQHVGRGPKAAIAQALTDGYLAIGDLVVTTDGEELVLIERGNEQVVIKSRTQEAITVLGTEIPAGSDIDAVLDVLAAKFTALNGTIGVVPEGKTVVQMIEEAQEAATYDDTELAGKVQANADAIAEAQGVITTLVGEDAAKSVRTIANEELAKQLIPEGAQESLDTLTEIAAWIQEHPGDAAEMNAAISALQAIVDGIGDVEAGEKATVVAYVEAAIAALNIGDYAKAADLSALADRVLALEGVDHSHANAEVLDGITAEKVAAWDGAQAAAEATAKAYTDAEIAKIDLSGIELNEEAIAAVAASVGAVPEDKTVVGMVGEAEAAAKAYTDEQLAASATTWVDFGA